MFSFFEPYEESIRSSLVDMIAAHPDFFRWFTAVSRFVLAALAVFVVIRVAISLFRGKKEPETWGYIDLPNGLHLPLNHWENVVGRAKNSDIVLNFATVSRNHAALMRREDGKWRLIDLGSKAGIEVNGEKIAKEAVVDYGDNISFGGVPTQLTALSSIERTMEENRETPGIDVRPSITFYLLTVFNIILSLQLCIANPGGFVFAIPITFTLMIAVIWIYFFIFRIMRRRGFEVETVAFLLSSVGLSVTASSEPFEIYKQFLAMVLGLILFIALGWFLRDLKRADLMRWPMAAAAIGLLLATILFGAVINGAKNWIIIGGFSIQPSEIAKLCFIYAGTATLDRLFSKRNLILYIVLTAAVGGTLAYMGDFGAALIFFVAFLVTAFMRSGDIATLSLICAGVGLGGVMLLRFRPYIAARFASWGHVWEDAVMHEGGFQQTRTMSAAASGGLFGNGAGTGWLKNIMAADTDLVFGIVCEELGLIVALCCISSIVILAVYACFSAKMARSTFYQIAACAATSMLVFQMMLNVLGSLDILPLTGVTFPFVSNGGSSMIACFGLLAFIKAADTRRNASFATKNESIFVRSRVE